jgi:hypothetical protein
LVNVVMYHWPGWVPHHGQFGGEPGSVLRGRLGGSMKKPGVQRQFVEHRMIT